MHALFDPGTWAAFLTLTSLELVLGVDNLVLLAIMTGRLPSKEQPRARVLGLAGAMCTRILLLLVLVGMTRFTRPLITVSGFGLSLRELVLVGGGIFLLAKTTLEIHAQIEGNGVRPMAARSATGRVAAVVVQVMLLDTVFSLDSVITAIGMTGDVPVMIAAIMAAVGTMMFFAGPVTHFMDRHPTVRTLALSFLILISVSLIGEGLGFEVPKEYIYFAMGFSFVVELINMRTRRQKSE